MKQLHISFLLGIYTSIHVFVNPIETKPVNTNRKSDYISVQELVAENKIDVSITGTGGHMESCVSVKVKNRTSEDVKVWLEAGRRLASVDPTEQDILISRNQMITLAAHKTKELDGYGFCCQSSNSCPSKGSAFSIGSMAPNDWVKLAQAIDTSNFPPYAVQHAVWVLSNNIPLSSVHDEDTARVKPLQNYIAEIKNVEFPWYTIQYEIDSERLFTNRPEHISGSINFSLRKSGKIDIIVRSQHGQAITTIEKDYELSEGLHSYSFTANVKDWPIGKYLVLVYENKNRLNAKKAFNI